MDALLSLLPGGQLTALGGALLVLLAALWRAFTAGRAAERGVEARHHLDAANDQLEMHREASEIERRVKDLPDEEARKEALKWSRPR